MDPNRMSGLRRCERTDLNAAELTDIRLLRSGTSESGATYDSDATSLSFLTSLNLTSSTSDGSQHIQALEKTLGLIDSILQPDRCDTMSLTGSLCMANNAESSGPSSLLSETRPKSFLHDEMNEFNQIFSELVSTPQRKFPCRGETGLLSSRKRLVNPSASSTEDANSNISSNITPVKPLINGDVQGLLINETVPLGCTQNDSTRNATVCNNQIDNEIISQGNHSNNSDEPILMQGKNSLRREPVLCSLLCNTLSELCGAKSAQTDSSHWPGESSCIFSNAASGQAISSSSNEESVNGFAGLECLQVNSEKNKNYEPLNEDDADSGYQTGESSVFALVSAAKKLEDFSTISCGDLQQRIERFNSNKQGLIMSLRPDSDSVFEGNIRVHMNLFRPIKMSLSSRPSSIYDILIRHDARLPENESNIASFHLPNNTFKAIHVTSETTTNLVIKTLLNKFNITDNPRRFALYERVLSGNDKKKDSKVDQPSLLNNTQSFVRRLADDERPLELCLRWAGQGLDMLDCFQFVLQENDPGEILWEAFSLPELNNFLRILAKEENAYADQIRTKYRLLKREMEKRLQRLEKEKSVEKSC